MRRVSSCLPQWQARFSMTVFRYCVWVMCLEFALVISRLSAGGQEAPAPSDDIGYVLHKAGAWLLVDTPAEEIHIGQRLPMGGKLKVKDPRMLGSSLTVVLWNGTEQQYYCNHESTCNQTYQLPTSMQPSSSLLQHLLQEVEDLFTQRPDRYSITAARGDDDRLDQLQEGILQIRDAQLDLRPVFQHMRRAQYSLHLCPLSSDESIRKILGPVEVSWDPAYASPARIPGLKPGLYGLILSDKPIECASDVEKNWIFVSAPETYEAAHVAFQEAIDLTKQWGEDGVPPEAKQAFLRATLEALSVKYQ